jgi:large subunit ribosomal protein L28
MRTCQLCGKGTKIGRNRSHAQNRSPRTFMANIQKISILVGEEKVSGHFCTKCIKKIKSELAKSKLAKSELDKSKLAKADKAKK